MQTMTIEVSRLMEQEDRISALPDNLIHHILSLLPSTKQAIRTGVLSKQWLNKWTQVPVLIFDSTGMSRDSFITAVDNTLSLHECSKIGTFHLHYDGLCTLNNYEKDPHLEEKILFATTKQVEDLSLASSAGLSRECFLPEFLFNTTCLVKLSIIYFSLTSIREVNWVRLKALNLVACRLSDQAMEHVLSGSPLLELLELAFCGETNTHLFKPINLAITTKSLKKLVLEFSTIGNLEISCPNLVELSVNRVDICDVKFRYVPPSLCATLYVYIVPLTKETRHSFTKDILQQLQHIKELRLGDFIMLEMLTGFSVGDPPFPLHTKCLILDDPVEHKPISGIIRLLQNFPVLETFVFKMFFTDLFSDDMADLDGFEENYWSSNHCLVSHLKRIKIYAIPREDKKPMCILNVIQFLLKNARVLENMTVVLKSPYLEQYSLEVSQELFGFTQSSKHATVELISECS